MQKKLMNAHIKFAVIASFSLAIAVIILMISNNKIPIQILLISIAILFPIMYIATITAELSKNPKQLAKHFILTSYIIIYLFISGVILFSKLDLVIKILLFLGFFTSVGIYGFLLFNKKFRLKSNRF